MIEMKDIPLFIIIMMPLAIVAMELFVYGLSEAWKWFIKNNEE